MRKSSRNSLVSFVVISGLVVVFLFLFTSCSTAKVKDFPTLANHGELPLSTSNPYVGANMFLSRELQKSPYLFGFFKGRGAPAAIAIEQSNFQPARLLMYYPRDKEVFAADMQTRPGDGAYEWIIRGPYAIERKDYKNLARMDMAMNGEPVFEIDGKPFRFRFQQDEASSKHISAPLPPPATPTPKAKPKKKVIYKASASATPAPVVITQDSGGKFAPLNTDQQAIQMAKGFAERAENGDLIHTVKTETETLGLLARWYTGSDAAAKEIAAYNGIADSDIFSPGKRVRIPLKLIKQFKTLSPDYK